MNKQAETLSLEEIVEKGVKLTPMMEQYYTIRKQYPGILLMFRMGDFYEVFFEDARNASRLLNISLTHRGKLGGYPIPMAGMPHHAASTYIDRLTAIGLKVAICEQVEDPKQAKGIVKRAVTQVVSPGMPFDLDKSSQVENSYMASSFFNEGIFYTSIIDFTTGDFFGFTNESEEELVEKLSILAPKEFIMSLGQWDNNEKLNEYLQKDSLLKTYLSDDYFDVKYTDLYIEKLIPGFKRDEVLKLHKDIICSIGALSYYICSTQPVESLTHLKPFQIRNSNSEMKITYPTLVGLEIFPKTRDNYKSSILGFIDNTKTSLGTRRLKSIFQSPLQSKALIDERLNTIQILLDNHDDLEEIREELVEIRDIERIMAKISTGKVNGGDLLNLARANSHYCSIRTLTKVISKNVIPTFSTKDLNSLAQLEKEIFGTINEQIGATLDKGNLIKDGCDNERDRLASLSQNASGALLDLELRYRELTGIPNLKVKHNNVAGYFIEVSKSHTNKVPKDFVRRQTLVNSERYQSEELAVFEKEMLSAQDKLHKLEREIFDQLVAKVSKQSSLILRLADCISITDVFQSFAWASFQNDLTRPVIDEKRKQVRIDQGWHPLIKSVIKDQFVCHDVNLDQDKYFGLITGPNMAGKTTVMREVAIIQFLTQVGCYVPATLAKVGLCDYIFSRLGASDDIIKGQSTFMVEMSETAEIIRHATENSLIILDEIGRGTSTYDGLSIAWSLVEHFVNKTKALTLFSTHYHELIELVNTLDNAKNLTVKTINENGNVQFLYKLIEEGAAQSFGIHVAKLAGLPPHILTRSSQILKNLETDTERKKEQTKEILNTDDQLNFLSTPVEVIVEVEKEEKSAIFNELKELDIMNMTPIQAMQKLHDLKSSYLN